MVTREYRTAKEIIGPLVLVDGVEGVTFGELTDIKLDDGSVRRGRVLEVNRDKAVVQVFEGTSGLSPENIAVKFLGKGIELGVSSDMLGRVFDGFGRSYIVGLLDRLRLGFWLSFWLGFFRFYFALSLIKSYLPVNQGFSQRRYLGNS